MNNKEKPLKKIKKPWPTRKVMEQIYDQNLWGGNENEFYSGFGSHSIELVEPYINVVKKFLRSFNHPITVCDLGCGDFNIGKQLFKDTKKYTAIDIVESLVKFNRKKYKAENLEFRNLDISIDSLPKADCVFVRQVLQHLSNVEVKRVLKKLNFYKFLILTEHIPQGGFKPNLDIISGQGIRLKKKSGINILEPPFNFKIESKKELISINLGEGKGRLVTTFFQVF